MTDEQKTNALPADLVSPDALMGDFRGKRLVVIIAFTVLVHAVLIVATSFSYLKKVTVSMKSTLKYLI